MKLLLLLLFLTSCNESLLTPREKEALKNYQPTQTATQAPVPAPTEEPNNVAKLEAKIKNKEMYSKEFEMTCSNDLVPDPSTVAIYRCENTEVICYSEYRGGMTCKFK